MRFELHGPSWLLAISLCLYCAIAEESWQANYDTFYRNRPELASLLNRELTPAVPSDIINIERKPGIDWVHYDIKQLNPGAGQFSGYFTEQARHFFFWGFDSRNDPANDPVIIVLSGDLSSCSSIKQVFHTGPFSLRLDDKPKSNPFMQRYNRHSWNNNATVIYLEYVLQQGFSYWNHEEGLEFLDYRMNPKELVSFIKLMVKERTKTNKIHLYGENSGAETILDLYDETGTENRETNGLPREVESVMLSGLMLDPSTQLRTVYEFQCDSGIQSACEELQINEPDICDKIDSAETLSDRLETIVDCLIKHVKSLVLIEKDPHNIARNCQFFSGLSCREPADKIETLFFMEYFRHNLTLCNENTLQNAQHLVSWLRNRVSAFEKLVNKGPRVAVVCGNLDQWTHLKGLSKVLESIDGSGNITIKEFAGAGVPVARDLPEDMLTFVNYWIHS